MGSQLLSAVKVYDPAASPTRLLRLEFEADDSMEMPLVWLVGHTLLYLWEVRKGGKIVDLTLTRASLKRKIALLRKTRFINETTLINELDKKSM